MNYDLIIPCHPKDYFKLKYCISSCVEFLNPKPQNIYIVSPNEFSFTSPSIPIHSIQDEFAIRTDINDINFQRKNWIYQQFIKLGQDFTKNDMYLCVDSDLFFNKPIELFDEDKPKFFISDREQHHQPYFNFMKISHDLDRQVDHTFINDFMMFDRSVCHEIIGNDLSNLSPLLGFCNKNLSDDCLLSEFELYGNYVSKHYPDLYAKQNTKTKMFGRHVNQPWNESEIDQYVKYMKDTDYDLFTMHTWT
jgi:hypothetical protein